MKKKAVIVGSMAGLLAGNAFALHHYAQYSTS
jgi:uncharacterized protein YllA (UPF0747 family)